MEIPLQLPIPFTLMPESVIQVHGSAADDTEHIRHAMIRQEICHIVRQPDLHTVSPCDRCIRSMTVPLYPFFSFQKHPRKSFFPPEEPDGNS